MGWERLLGVVVALLLAPLLLGVITRVKARFAGRRGAPLVQPYFELRKLMAKRAVYSRTTSWHFQVGPWISLSAIILALLLVPRLGQIAPTAFPGDPFLLVYLLGVGRLFTVLAALDTGSAFEGMGASRELHFAVFTEISFFFALAALARSTSAWSLSGVSTRHALLQEGDGVLTLVLVGVTLFVVLLAENARIPVDDPNTHLELTMVHEVMVLDHSGPELGAIHYGMALKLWLFASLLVSLVVPIASGSVWLDGALWLLAVFGVGAAVGVVESVMARLRLLQVARLIMGAGLLSVTALLLS